MFDELVSSKLYVETPEGYVVAGAAIITEVETRVDSEEYPSKTLPLGDVLYAAETALGFDASSKYYVHHALVPVLNKAWTSDGKVLHGLGSFTTDSRDNLIFQLVDPSIYERIPDPFLHSVKEIGLLVLDPTWQARCEDRGYVRGVHSVYTKMGPLTEEEYAFIRQVPHDTGYYQQTKRFVLDATQIRPPPPDPRSATKAGFLADLAARVSHLESFLASTFP